MTIISNNNNLISPINIYMIMKNDYYYVHTYSISVVYV